MCYINQNNAGSGYILNKHVDSIFYVRNCYVQKEGTSGSYDELKTSDVSIIMIMALESYVCEVSHIICPSIPHMLFPCISALLTNSLIYLN